MGVAAIFPGPAETVEPAGSRGGAYVGRLLEEMPVSLTRIAEDGTFLAANGAALSTVGAERLDQVLDTSLFDLLAPDSRDHCRAFLSRVVAGERGSIEVVLTAHGGLTLTLQLHAIVHPNPADAVASVLCSFRDVTEHRRLEREVEASVAQAAARCEALQVERDALQAERDAVRAERDGARAAHERDALRWAAERTAAADDVERANALARAVMHAASLAGPMLRADGFAGRPRVAAGPAVRALESMLGGLARPNVAFTTLVGTDRADVPLTEAQVYQLVIALAANGRAAMTEAGRMSLEVAEVDIDEACGSERCAAPGAYVLLALHANGSGIEGGIGKDLIGTPASALAWESAGPGMAGVYQLVVDAGGFLWATREGPDAIAFEVYLPRLAAADARAGSVAKEPR